MNRIFRCLAAFGTLALPGLVPISANAQNYVFDRSYGNSGGSSGGQLDGPYGVAIDSNGILYVADDNKNRIVEYESSGALIKVIGVGSSVGSSSNGRFNGPDGVALDGSGNLYVADHFNNRIEEFDSNGAFVRGFGAGYSGVAGTIGSYGAGNGQLREATAVTVDTNGNVYASDELNNRVVEFSSSGAFLRNIGRYGTGNGHLSLPGGITLDGSGNLYVVDQGNQRIVEFDNGGTFVRAIGSPGQANGQLNLPEGVALDKSGNIYVADTYNHRIEEYYSNGDFVQSIGSYGFNKGQFNFPVGVSFDSSGNLYVVDYSNQRVDKFDAVPEPGSVALLVGMITVGAGILRKQRK